MKNIPLFDVIIIGGSYSGLAAGMSLGRALRNVLIIDSGNPCNHQTPQSHNFITQDGKTPKEISLLAKAQVEKYPTVTFYQGLATKGKAVTEGFEITTEQGDVFLSKKLIFATGVKDMMPDIKGFAECWGISMLHCPYCHGYEVKNEKTGILGNGDFGFEFSKMISHWTKDLTLFTNGPSSLTTEQTNALKKHHIRIVENTIDHIALHDGMIDHLYFKDGSITALKAMYARPAFMQHCRIPETLGCEITELGYVQVDPFQKTSVPGIYACGDNTTFMRSVATAVAMGTLAGAMLNKEMIEETF